MTPELTSHEIRVIGCLLEKQITTPEQYPLSLNALTNACNQKSNRDPVLALEEAAVQRIVDQLVRKRLVSEQSGYGNRVPKYQHLFCNTHFGTLQFSPQETGIVCELFLRGPQTPGELRSRASRLCQFADAAGVETILEQLAAREDGPFVRRLAREAGRRESRYVHLFGVETGNTQEDWETQAHEPTGTAQTPADERVSRLESRVAMLETEVLALQQRLIETGGGN